MSKNETKRINNILYGPTIEIHVDDNGLGRTLFNKFQENSHKIFQINPLNNEQETYQHVNKKSIRLALELKKRNITSNDIILIYSSNDINIIVPFLSTLYVNAKTATLDPSVSLQDTTHLLNLIRPKIIFVQEASVDFLESALLEAPFKSEIIVMGLHNKYTSFSEFQQPKSGENSFIPDKVADVNDAAIIFFSSGTTGISKAIEISHYYVMYATINILTTTVPFDDSMPFSTFYWGSAVIATIITILTGSRRFVVNGFQTELVLATIQKYGMKNIFLAPALSYLITKDLVKKYPCPELKYISFVGSSITMDQLKNIKTYFPRSTSVLLYALTESAGPVTCFVDPILNEKTEEKFISSGLPIGNVRIKIVDLDTEATLGPHQKGEIRVLTQSFCSGYYLQDSSDMFDKDGYLKTGDVGYYDDKNYLYICDRIKDMFKYRNWHIIPLSIENIIHEHPSVQEVLVIGIPSKVDGHIPMGLVILKNDEASIVTEEDLLKYANSRLIDREQLRAGLKIVKNLPKGPTGKLLRKYVTALVVSGEIEKLME